MQTLGLKEARTKLSGKVNDVAFYKVLSASIHIVQIVFTIYSKLQRFVIKVDNHSRKLVKLVSRILMEY